MRLARLPFDVDEAEARRYLGVPASSSYQWDFSGLCLEVSQSASPRAVYIRLSWPESGSLLPGLSLSSDIRELLADAHAIYVMAATLGGDIDSAIDRHMAEGNYAKAVSMDAIASVAAEGAMHRLWCDLAQSDQLAFDERLEERFSPGYGDLPLNFQQELMRVLDLSIAGISVSESSILVPRKSVTAIAGVVKCSFLARVDHGGCQRCPKRDCNYRKQGGKAL